jgi:hypothetical protein
MIIRVVGEDLVCLIFDLVLFLVNRDSLGESQGIREMHYMVRPRLRTLYGSQQHVGWVGKAVTRWER